MKGNIGRAPSDAEMLHAYRVTYAYQATPVSIAFARETVAAASEEELIQQFMQMRQLGAVVRFRIADPYTAAQVGPGALQVVPLQNVYHLYIERVPDKDLVDALDS